MSSADKPPVEFVRTAMHTARVLALLCIAAVVVYIVELGLVRFKSAKAARLVDSVRTLKIGVTTSDQVRQLSERFGGTLYAGGPVIRNSLPVPASPTYFLIVASPRISLRDRCLSPLGPGLRWWAVTVNMSVEDGHLSEYFLDVVVQRSDGVELDSRVSATEELLIGSPEASSYFVHEPHVTGPPTEALDVNITPQASPEERDKAFGFDLGCLTSLRQCGHVCQLSPSAWPDLREHRQSYEDGREKVVSAECENALAGAGKR